MGRGLVSADFRHLRHPGFPPGAKGPDCVRLRPYLLCRHRRDVLSEYGGQVHHHLFWGASLPGCLYAIVAPFQAASGVGFGAFGAGADCPGAVDFRQRGCGLPLAHPSGTGARRFCLLGLFPLAFQPGLFPGGRLPGENAVPEKGDPSAPGKPCQSGAGLLYPLREVVFACLPSPPARHHGAFVPDSRNSVNLGV